MVSVSTLDLLGSFAVFGGGKCVITTPEGGADIAAATRALASDDTLLMATLERKLYNVDPGWLDNEAIAPAESEPAAVILYTFAVNRSEMKGSLGSIRAGTTAGLNPLELLHLRTVISWMS
jgi:hypothetical protein